MSSLTLENLFVLMALMNYRHTNVHSDGRVVIDLFDIPWIIQDEKSIFNVTSTLPADVYSTLFNNGLIPDPYRNRNDVDWRNISDLGWNFTASLGWSSDFENFAKYVLTVDGVDTVADVYFDDAKILTVNNMFRSYTVDITQQVKMRKSSKPTTTITLTFKSPVKTAHHLNEWHVHQYCYNIPPDCPPPIQNGLCHVNMLRKMQSSFSWDWGPGFGTSGIYGKLYVTAYNDCTLVRFSVVPNWIVDNTSSEWLVYADFDVDCVNVVESASLVVSIDELNHTAAYKVNLVVGLNQIRKYFVLPSQKVELWWPNGFGNHKLYTVVGVLIGAPFKVANSTTQKIALKTGFRKLELIQKQVKPNSDGLTFYFTVNDVKIFLKGSNWIPADSFLPRITNETLRFYFESMKQANMNAIRVWGGGIYETDQFYDLADEFGILIWQDMMFAVSLYPGNNEFLDNVRAEVRDQVNRLKHHPCIIVWAGNNENEQGMADGWFDGSAEHDVYANDYKALYWDTIHDEVSLVDYNSRPYLVSSPSNGAYGPGNGSIDPDPGSSEYGDVHYYNYFSNLWDSKVYPVARCVSEYGFQALPSAETLSRWIDAENLTYYHPMVTHRQHSSGAHEAMLLAIASTFAVPKCSNNSSLSSKEQCQTALGNLSFGNIVYLTQVYQAMAYKVETEHYRRWMSEVDEQGLGLTMCALYWQLNDIWPGMSWSTIDYDKKWKMGHYYARKFFSTILVSPDIQNQTLTVHVVSDLKTALRDLTLHVETYIFGQFQPVFEQKVQIGNVPATASVKVMSSNTSQLLPRTRSKNPEDLYVFFVTQLFNQTHLLAANFVFPPKAFLKYPTHVYGRVRISNVTQSKNDDTKLFSIQLSTTSPAPFVWLDVKICTGWFSDNGFLMTKATWLVNFVSFGRKPISLDKFKAGLSVTTLADLYERI